MRQKFAFACIIFSLFVRSGFAQDDNKYILAFHPSFGNASLHLDDYYNLKSGDSIQIELLRFYISEIELLNNSKAVWKVKNSFHLLDVSKDKSLIIPLGASAKISFNQIKFNLGVDSTTNISGALGGDLDPTLGMYWTWQSGYINFKIEGKSNLCKTRNNEFQFHVGGYASPYPTTQTVKLNVSGNERTDIILDLEQFINNINLSKENQVMTPGKDAALISEKLSKAFRIKQ